MDHRLEAVRCCLPYATSTTHTEQLEDVVAVVVDEALAESEQAVHDAEALLARVRVVKAVGSYAAR